MNSDILKWAAASRMSVRASYRARAHVGEKFHECS